MEPPQGVTNAFAMPRLLPMTDRDKDVEVLTPRHQITVLEGRLGNENVRFDPSDRAFLVALLRRLPLDTVGIQPGYFNSTGNDSSP
jgi:hypothetical protein